MRLGRFVLVAVLAAPLPVSAQSPPAQRRADDHAGMLIRVDTRFAFLAAGSDSFGNRPLLGVDVGLQPRRAVVGAGPTLGFTVGATIGDGEFLAESKLSYRLVVGVEAPWAIAARRLGSNPAEVVPSLQVGYMKVLDEDQRDGLVLRAGIGVRLLPSGTSFYFTLEPLALLYLPEAGRPDAGSRLAVEMSVLKFGWRF